MPDVTVLDVMLYGKVIGTLTHIQGDRTLFAFRQDYIDDPQRPLLSLSYKDSFGELITDFRTYQTRVPPFFANMLPEGPMREYLAERAGVNPKRDFFLLWVLGQDLPGAVTVRPAEGQEWPPGRDGKEAGEAATSNRESALRFSLAGVQLKLSAVRESTGGLTIPAQGIGGDWIVKLPSAHYRRVPENEYAMMRFAGRLGMNVPDVQLIDVDSIGNLPEGIDQLDEKKALAVKRFDRMADGTPVHMEDFAQIFSVFPEEKYGAASYRNIASVLGIETGEEDIAEFIRRLVFNTLIGNADMHLKNWSLIYPDGRRPVLAPAYDFVSTIAYIRDETAALKYARTKKMRELSINELAYLAGKAHLPETLVIRTARQTVEAFMDSWGQAKEELPIDERVSAGMDAHIERLAIVRD
ncbi:MAG: type II toxin-antitoxin system HipA family toxin [Pseudomonadota bacterium]